MKDTTNDPIVQQRFSAKVGKRDPNDCWEWLGSKDGCGYGTFAIGRKVKNSHRVAWQIENGEIPDGMCVCHRCDNPPCCNPGHLFLGTHSDNMKDMSRKGRAPRGEKSPSAKITEGDVREIRRLVSMGVGQTDIAKEFGIAISNVSQISNRKRWRHVK